MRFSHLFTKTKKEAPRDEVAKNAVLLVRGGFIDKVSAGVYTFLPLGVRVLKKIEAIIRFEMNTMGAQEILMPSLHPKENWEKTGRWESMDDLYKVTDTHGREFALGPTHEEIVVPLMREFISSYKDLPVAVYQFQNKFRMELRAKSGLLRGKEFLMKDMYSFHADEENLTAYYEAMKETYKRVFSALGISSRTYLTFASGGTFSKYSHEFQTVTDAGEDTIFLCESCAVAINKEIADEKKCPQCGRTDLREKRSIEVGNIFELKTKFSDPFGLSYKDEKGNLRPILMGCYGLGLSRLLGAVVEVSSDERGIIWPRSIAPFGAHLTALGIEKQNVKEKAEEIYKKLSEANIEVLYDDREASAGVKLQDADLIGIPRVIIISERTLSKGDVVEIKDRESAATEDVPIAEILRRFSSFAI